MKDIISVSTNLVKKSYICHPTCFNVVMHPMKSGLLLLTCLGTLFLGTDNLPAQTVRTETFSRTAFGDHYSARFNIDLPVSTEGVVGSIRFLLSYVIESSLNGEGENIAYPPFSGDWKDSQVLTEYFFSNTIKRIHELATDGYEESGDAEYFLSLDYSLKKGYENDRLVVFDQTFNYHESGMMRDDFYRDAITFDKQKGEIFIDFFGGEPDLSRFQPMIRKGLCEYFGVNPEDLLDELQVDGYTIPLPRAYPCPSAEGLVFTYSQGEIAPESAASPSFTVPYDEVITFLSPEGKRFFTGGRDVTRELSGTALELCSYIPDHFLTVDTERFLTPDYFRAVDEAFSAPDGSYGYIGDSEWLRYFVSGQDGGPLFKVKDVILVDQDHALADIEIRIEGWADSPVSHRCIKMRKMRGRWLLDDYEDTKQECRNYVKAMRKQYKSGEILRFLQSNEDTREYVPAFKESVESFYKQFGEDSDQ